MSVQLSQQQLDQLAQGTSGAVVVQDAATKRKYAVLSERVYQRARPLLELISGQIDPGEKRCGDGEPWTEADNDRRIALINKKYDSKLTKAEQDELSQLQDRAYWHREQVAPVRNEVLSLLLEALEHRTKSTEQQ
jgi:hypothetical protein